MLVEAPDISTALPARSGIVSFACVAAVMAEGLPCVQPRRAVARASRMGLHRQGSGRQGRAKGSRRSRPTVKGTICDFRELRLQRFRHEWRATITIRRALAIAVFTLANVAGAEAAYKSSWASHSSWDGTWEGMLNKTDPVSVTIAGGKVVGYTIRGFTPLPIQSASVGRSSVSRDWHGLPGKDDEAGRRNGL